ncbi:NACHT, LRR and PYD domains-containing protein 12-like isoform X2 [Notamacropus eugenii]|uniref:NACHT, LRR and PYD domains-containing protein 12-like isoform X2 n=1 Tax=Notamacropus eugenii TaxID=9315 RepID=UPI003B66CC33
MAETARCRLVRYLEHLTSEELKKFKLYLVDCLPRGCLEEADRPKVADLLVSSLGEPKAWELALSIWEKMGLRELWERARKGERNKYRERMRKKFQLMRDRNHRPGENELFQHRFTQLLLLQEHRYKEQKHHELLVQGWRHAEVMEERGEPIEVSALFDPDQKTGIQPHTVVLQGAAGIGKTTLAIKVMLDWAEGQLYQERFDYVFYLTCRELNTIGVNVLSFADLIASDWPGPQAPMTEIMSQPERLLFIIDGLNELKFPCNENRCDLCKDWNQQRPVSILLSSLLRKMLLPEASLLLTTRLTALGKFSPLLEDPRHVEILGFSWRQSMEYFCKFFRNEELGKEALYLVRVNASLFTMFSVPLMNWIICTCLKQQEEKGHDPIQALITTTALYTCYFNSLTPDDKNFMPQHLKGLCGLAAEGIWQRKLLFEEEDLRRHNLEAADVSAFLDMNIFQKDSGCENCYSFIHLSFQEFFAAMFYLMKPDEKWEKNPDSSIPDVKTLLLECSEHKASFLALVVQFLFGFLNAEIASELKRKFRCRMSLEVKIQLLEWVERETKRDNVYSCPSNSAFPNWPSLLYESHNAEFVTHALVNVKEMKLMSCFDHDILVNTFCIKHCPGIQRLFHHCHFIRLPAFWEDFMSVIFTSQYLRELHLFSTQCVDIHMEKLCMELRKPNCKLEELCLFSCMPKLLISSFSILLMLEGFKVPYSCCECLFSSPSLKILHLCDIIFVDDGMKLPCETLGKENFQLETLEITYSKKHLRCGLASFLSETVKNFPRFPYIQSVMELLYSVLAQQNCKLQTLRLVDCHLTHTHSQNLFSALICNKSLKDLDLSLNSLEESGIKLLCEALGNPNCKLSTLRLSRCALTTACLQDLLPVICSSENLKTLDLSHNVFDDKGIKLLCEALEKQDCNLEKLFFFQPDGLSEESRRALTNLKSRKSLHLIL